MLHAHRKRIATALAGAAIVALIGASPASAYPIDYTDYLWRSSISDARVGFQSRRWEDSEYSEVLFMDCQPYSADGVTVQLRMDVNNAPDKSYDDKTFTNCFKGYNHWSQGEWHDLPDTSGNSSEYYFQITNIAGASKFYAGVVQVDETAAD